MEVVEEVIEEDDAQLEVVANADREVEVFRRVNIKCIDALVKLHAVAGRRWCASSPERNDDAAKASR